MSAMKRLILTTDDSGAGNLRQAGLADIVIPFGLRFVWGPLPTPEELATLLAARSAEHGPPGSHWLDFVRPRRLEKIGENGLGLIELCERCETIDLWVDPDPNSQLTLIWLLDYLHHQAKVALNLTLVQADVRIGEHPPEELATWRLPAVKIRNDHLEQASTAWRAYRAPTPQDWFNLLSKDLTVLPQLPQTVLEVLEELPSNATALGATEMRMLELISAGNAGPFDVFPGYQKRNQRRVSATGRSEPCSTGWLIVRRPPCAVLTRGRSRWRCTTTVTVTSDIQKADCRSRHWARLF
jgi:hypothetical protein